VCSASIPIPQALGGSCNVGIYGPGHHVVTAQPHIVGQADPSAVTLDIDFELACALGREMPRPSWGQADELTLDI
jgi:hypothetical protein